MFLGTPRIWWIAVGVAFVGGLVLIVTDLGETLGNVIGVLLLVAAITLFAGAPMRYGESAAKRRANKTRSTRATPDTPAAPGSPPTPPPRPRANIEARDASEV